MRNGKKFPAALLAAAMLFAAIPADGAPIVFTEQFYGLFRMRLQREPGNHLENIHWLERALAADFANPLHALATIDDETQWEKYRLLFRMHLNVKIAEQYLFLSSQWSRRQAFFFNAPWREQNLESFEIAEGFIAAASFHWEEAVRWAAQARDARFRFVDLPRVQFWTDSAHRIGTGDLDYGRTIRRELANIERMREMFRAMPDPVRPGAL